MGMPWRNRLIAQACLTLLALQTTCFCLVKGAQLSRVNCDLADLVCLRLASWAKQRAALDICVMPSFEQ